MSKFLTEPVTSPETEMVFKVNFPGAAQDLYNCPVSDQFSLILRYLDGAEFEMPELSFDLFPGQDLN